MIAKNCQTYVRNFIIRELLLFLLLIMTEQYHFQQLLILLLVSMSIMSLKIKKKLFSKKISIVNLLVPNIHYRTIWINKKTIIKGTSFACAYITGLISLKCDSVEKYNYQHLFDVISSDTRILPRVTKVTTFEYSPKKVIIFPLNKGKQFFIAIQR